MPMDDDRSADDAAPTGAEDAPTDGESGGALEPAKGALPSGFDAAKLPATKLTPAAPSKPAKGLAFGSILIGGLCGGLIGYAFTDLQCTDGCTGWAGVGGVIGALVGAIGVAIVAVLVLRAMDEWETIKDRDPARHPSRRNPPG